MRPRRTSCRRATFPLQLRNFPWRVFLWRVLGAALLVVLIAPGGASATEPYSFATTPGRLPKAVVPISYALDLKPDIEKLKLPGSEVIEIEVSAPTDRIVLNALDMTVETAAIEDLAAGTIWADVKAQTVTLTFTRPIAVGRHQLRIGFTATINRFGRGIFVVDYPTAEGRKRMLSTQLEPADARRIFPSFDEPAFKASIELTVTVPQELLAVSNMPPAREELIGGGQKRVSFPPTPKMSSYLFVLAVGDLERITGDADEVTVGVVTTRGKSAKGRYALDSAIELLRYYNNYFDTKYPLPKLDLIAVPGGFGGAMENWGGITFFESRLLFDPATSAMDLRRSIFIILAHEMAHQWFGDLVTTAWWDNLWLNEGFASWMQTKSAEALHPEWQSWLNGGGAKQAAMSEDARRTTHPIQQPIANESEAMAVFDVITYSKGQAFIRMLENYLGEDAFRVGIRDYMKRHAYSNATTADLWRALEAASGKPVTAIAASYTEQPGVPLISVQESCVEGRQRVVLRQERFTIHDSDPKAQRWQVPVALGPLAGAAPRVVLLDGSMEIVGSRCGEPTKLNLGDVGYYRVDYDAATRAALAKSVKQMAPADRVNLLADTWAMVEAGRATPAAFFDLLDQFAGEESRAVWEQVIRIFSRIDHLQWGRPQRAAFQAYARSVLRPAFDRLGWDAAVSEQADQALLRSRLIGMLGAFGDEAILAEARRRFALFVKDPAALSTDLRDVVTHLAGRTADRVTYDTLIGMARKTTNTDERVRYYSAAAGALDPAFAKETLAIALTDELPTSLVGTTISWVASQGEHPDLAWAFVRENFAALAAKQGPSFRYYFASNLMTNFTDAAHAADLAGFAPVHETSGGRMIAARSNERIMTDADFSEQQLPAIDEWIKTRGGR